MSTLGTRAVLVEPRIPHLQERGRQAVERIWSDITDLWETIKAVFPSIEGPGDSDRTRRGVADQCRAIAPNHESILIRLEHASKIFHMGEVEVRPERRDRGDPRGELLVIVGPERVGQDDTC